MKRNRILTFLVLTLCVLFIFSCIKTPTYKKIRDSAIGSDQFLLDRDDQVLQQLRTDFNKRQVSWVPLSSYPKNLRETVIQIEDQRFYSHLGIDPLALIRAARSLITSKRLEGGSTITMQLSDLINNEVLFKNRRIKKGYLLNKFSQIYKAFLIDLKWSKKEILETYLNLIHLKGEHQGIQSFTLAYLQKSPNYLTQSENLILASLIRTPNARRPKLKARTCYNANRILGSYDCKLLDNTLNEIYNNKPNISNESENAPHLARKLFKEHKKKTFVKSYIDSSIQKKVYSILKKNLSYLQKNNVTDISAVVIDNKSGEVLSYIGTVSEFSKSRDVDGASAPRQAGSTLKPFIYARALEKKLVTTSSIISDESTVIPWAGGLYRPGNYDKKFHGNVTLRQALASSLNVPAIKIVKILGLPETYDSVKDLQFSDLQSPDFYGASIILGAVEVRLHELANAYRAIANNGVLTPLKWNKETDSKKKQEISHKIMSPEVSYLTKSMLSDANARSIGFGWDSALETSFWTAVKTGTSKGLRDNWCIGFSESYTVGVWAGNFSAKAMSGVSGVSGAAPSWYEIMSHLHSNKKSLAPKTPEGIVSKKIKFEWKVGEQTEYFLKGTEPLNNNLISLPNKYDLSITFPAKGSTLAINPHRGKQSEAIFVRYKGTAPPKSVFYLNDEPLGELTNPFKVSKIKRGKYNIKIKSSDDTILDDVDFEIK